MDRSPARTDRLRRTRPELERDGQPVGGNDLLIAAQAITLVTDNERATCFMGGLMAGRVLSQRQEMQQQRMQMQREQTQAMQEMTQGGGGYGVTADTSCWIGDG